MIIIYENVEKIPKLIVLNYISLVIKRTLLILMQQEIVKTIRYVLTNQKQM